MTPSIGICLYPDDGTDQEQLLMQADPAMYEAKEEGKNSFRFFATQMTSSSSRAGVFDGSAGGGGEVGAGGDSGA